MKLARIKKISHILLIISLVSLFIVISEVEPAEQMDVEVALGADLERTVDNDYTYIITRSTYVFEEKGRSSKTITSKGDTIAAARESRQQLADKMAISGLEKIYMLNENYAMHGIASSVDIIFKNPHVNNTGIFVICRNSSKDILQYSIPGYASSADFIEGMIINQRGTNFFPDEFDAVNTFVKMDSEGRSVVLPYIELTEEGIVITGEALFSGDKMLAKADMKDSRILNMLKYNKVRGIITIQENSKEYIDLSAKTKKKVRCFKEGDKYNFIIDLNLKGEVVSNTLYTNLLEGSNSRKEFENAMKKQVEKQCNEFIDKMKNQLKVDCLDLGRVAAAKYGRRMGNDWNKIVLESNIQVNVMVEVDKYGRGDF
ncbi:Ger(x)C family germination protein [Clostridium pascui]|uniref:Ger(x)C family spore germination C-terminal domain-containing protein n=1 Tax=Clostridium pascui TaxID=46609 RepID=UPI001957BE8E|nr:Ger(x)C family spore germination C-terminal domain-containing protein [Clostridium pascui]MBM7870462.1 Ger(x)C family germination protein [Clostridium pascui]